jgi:hypothetical protein
VANFSLLSADTLTETLPDEESSWAHEESTEALNARPEPRKMPPSGKVVMPRIWDLTRATSGTSPSAGVITGTVSAGAVTTGTVSAGEETIIVVHSAEGRAIAVYSAGGMTATLAVGTPQLFSSLINARGDLREQIYEGLLRRGEPEILLCAALDAYHKYGNEERLALAASLLADMGARALPALQSLAQSGSPECGMFVPVIAHLHGVSVQDRLTLLAALASNPNVYVRYSLLEELQALPAHDVMPLLQTLSRDADDDIADEARAYLESLPS